MKWNLFAPLLILMLACVACSSRTEVPTTTQSNNEQAASGDDRSAAQLIGLAKQHREIAVRAKEQTESACRTDSKVIDTVIRDSTAAHDSWDAAEGTDYLKMERSACLNALRDVADLAQNCGLNTYSTVWAAAKERHYAEDIADCDKLLADPPPVADAPV